MRKLLGSSICKRWVGTGVNDSGARCLRPAAGDSHTEAEGRVVQGAGRAGGEWTSFSLPLKAFLASRMYPRSKVISIVLKKGILPELDIWNIVTILYILPFY